MNTRLQQFLELEGLSAARFADLMGIQRSGISHLLSGRNKPGYDFIQKFLTRFPQVNADWFILGKGKPYKTPDPLSPAGRTGNPDERTEPGADAFPGFASGFAATPFPSDISLFSPEERHPAQPESDETAVISTAGPGKTALEAPTKPVPPRKIGRITVFWSDGSFEEFYPRK